ncbi:hypothetical protein TRP8649_02077 [Pelagimonas phthalicica]|uniref:Fe-S protein n=1 Tax=Pelagimonas phthalicica TaxID=1037362 RepID=A0A238JC23_9RHOB|nr:DUF1289 domain-containing protein [Tropicibacter sp. R15_0]TDS90918.1 putative Fe-S protein YdhL (DUF1289 family) [Pelagimonas phthalicica]SMX27965.1 hypothetical protein TRP8649_02077 [Pelagimonas phthalicica]
MSLPPISCKERWTDCAISEADVAKDQDKNKVWKRDEIESPCIQICVVHPEARICTGCLRSIDEITSWSKMSHEERSDIMAALPERKSLLTKRRGGRKARLAKG